MRLLITNLRPAVSMTLLMTVLLGLGYPLAMIGVGQTLFSAKANGSLLMRDGSVIGSTLIGQSFSDPRYLIGRPSAVAYDAANSGGSNLGPSSRNLIASVRSRVDAIRALENETTPTVDRVTASASGLDPHISYAGALQQVDRIARLRGVDPTDIRTIIEGHVEGSYLGFIGEKVVNVLAANLALDITLPVPTKPKVGGDVDSAKANKNE